jgi:hypothetical protein
VKLKVYAGTRYVGSTVEDEIEIDDEDIEGMSEDQKQIFFNDLAHEWMLENIEWGFEEESA